MDIFVVRLDSGALKRRLDKFTLHHLPPSIFVLLSLSLSFLFKKIAVGAFAMDSRSTLLTSVTAFLRLVAHCFLLLLDS